MTTKNQLRMLLEANEAKFQLIMEYLQDVPNKARIRELEEQVADIDQRLEAARQVVTSHSQRLRKLES